MAGRVLRERRGATLLLTLDNPARGNALDGDMLAALSAVAADVVADRGLRAVVLTAQGERAFCTGADIAAWGSLDPVAFGRQWIADGHRLFDRLASLTVPLIGALNGATFGGGLELAALCDVRVAAPHALFALPETGLGVTAGWSGLQRLGRLMPQALLREMALTGARLTAARLEGVGFLNAVAEDPLAHALAIAERCAGLAPRAVEATRLVLNAAAGEGREAAIDGLAGMMVAMTDDSRAGREAFAAKRPPRFTGD